jgi:colicin import membrane protein
VVLPATSVGGQEAVSYRALVFSQISKAKRFPEAARARGASGVAVVSFSIDDAGNPLGVTLAHSSGDPDIDGEIVAMIGRAAPFPPPPQGAQRNFSAAIEFGHDE